HISAFNPTTGKFLGQLVNAQNQPLALTGGSRIPNALWGIAFGNGAAAGPANTLYFASGINGEADGLFGSLTAVTISTTSAVSHTTVKGPATKPAANSGGSNTGGSNTGGSNTGGSTGGGGTVYPWVVASAASS